MKLPENARLNGHWLNRTEIRMAHTIIEVNNLYIRRQSVVHTMLAAKIERAKNRHTCGDSSALVVVKLTEEEGKLMRAFNSTYCAILADKILAIENKTGEIDSNGLEAYALATKVHYLFSSHK